MKSSDSHSPAESSFNVISRRFHHQVMPLITAVLAAFAIVAPLMHGDSESRIGFLLVVTALLEMTHGFRRADYEDQKSAWSGGAISLGLGFLLLGAPLFASQALRLFLAGWYGLEGVRYLFSAVRGTFPTGYRSRTILLGVMNSVIAFIACQSGQTWLIWIIAFAAAFRILTTALTMVTSPVLTPDMLSNADVMTAGLPEDARVHSIAHQIAVEETARASVDRNWILSFLLTLLAIHVGRMGFDRTFLGLMSPGFAVLGDVFAGLLLAFLIVIPAIVASNRLTRRLERAAWLWCVQEPSRYSWLRAVVQSVLKFRLRQLIRLRQARCSFATAISRGLQIGLPLAAIIAATAPMWGMSWYFDTENWAAGVWNSWAEHRTDTWRLAMTAAVSDSLPKNSPEQIFAVHPEGVASAEGFSFLVIGDPGEGDASQYSLKSSFQKVAARDNVKFVVISSDVVYPTGAMKNYEANFWLPFMGTSKPVYAIPGNHDWYDALEGFAATFFEPSAARIAMRARVEADARITSTTDSGIENLIATATRLRREYQIPTQLQQAPYFQFQTREFALFAIDTGVARRIDEAQWTWLENGLVSARGKSKMVILGHPFFAGGRDQSAGEDSEDFQALRELLRKHRVSVIMAGDTHDLEYYQEETSTNPAVHHFVNGGGGAYLSFGTSLDWPPDPVTSRWAFFPSREQVVSKIEATTPLWKKPAWLWTKKLRGWPFSAEWLSAAFDSNTAPFYQSFMEVRVEPEKKHLRLIPYGVLGQLRYSDLQLSAPVSDSNANDLVEWIVPMEN